MLVSNWRLTLTGVAAWLLIFMDCSLGNPDDIQGFDYNLQSIYIDYMLASGGDEDTPTRDRIGLVWKDQSKLLVEVTASAAGAERLLQPAFEAYDFETMGCSTFQCSGYLPIINYPDFTASQEVKEVYPSLPAPSQAGSVVSEALKSLRVDLVRAAYPSLTGAGLSIGILSDSFNMGGRGSYMTDISTGDLPNDVTVLREFSGTGSDEGRAMAQLIHDLVPGAQLFFRTAIEGAA